MVQTQEYKECFTLLSFQSRDELCKRISNVEEIVLTEIRKKNHESRKIFEEFFDELVVYVNNLKVVGIGTNSDIEEMEVEEQQNVEGLFSDCKDRTKLKSVSDESKNL